MSRSSVCVLAAPSNLEETGRGGIVEGKGTGYLGEGFLAQGQRETDINFWWYTFGARVSMKIVKTDFFILI